VIEGKEEAVIIDSRTTGEYEGTDVRALRGGRIPKAVHMDYSRNIDPESNCMRPISELKSIYKDISSDSRIITYCHTGARAAYSYLVLRALGYEDVAVFHDGWRVYGSNVNLPVENEVWFDFTRVNHAVNVVQKLHEKMK
jgi:thiosulfate/3-mercaptopyruvate sulfurtransferase